jgi:molecular chaperone DnaK
MGQGFAEVSAEAKRVSYKIVKETTIHHVWILMVVYTAQELSAMTLQKMKNC